MAIQIREWISIFFISSWFFFATIPLSSAVDFATQPSFPSSISNKNVLIDIALTPNRLLAAGERGHILYSDDKGKNWQQANVPVSANLTALFFIDGSLGWAVGHDATIMHTKDGGKNWHLQYSDTEGEIPLLNVWFKNELEGFAIGAYGLLLHTIDGGKAWTDQSEKTDNPDGLHLYDIIFINNETLLISGEMGLILRSDNAGNNWQQLQSPYEGSFFGGLFLEASNELFLYGLRGHIFKSADLGNSWEELFAESTVSLMGGTVLNDGRVVLVGNSGTILVSSDNRSQFSSYIHSDRIPLSNIVAIDNHQLVLVGQNGVHLTDLNELKK